MRPLCPHLPESYQSCLQTSKNTYKKNGYSFLLRTKIGVNLPSSSQLVDPHLPKLSHKESQRSALFIRTVEGAMALGVLFKTGLQRLCGIARAGVISRTLVGMTSGAVALKSMTLTFASFFSYIFLTRHSRRWLRELLPLELPFVIFA